jgi:thiopeptide-type bacteriocin biosynthesis protein
MPDRELVVDPELRALSAPATDWLQVDCALFAQMAGTGPHVPWIELRTVTERWRAEGRFERFALLRKPPGLRMRFLGPEIHVSLAPVLFEWLQELTRATDLRGVRPSTYEPEVHRFGGPAGIQAQHLLADHDSRLVIEYEARVAAGEESAPRGELSISILGDLVRGGVDDPAEAWDVWMRLRDALGAARAVSELTAAGLWSPAWFDGLSRGQRELLGAWRSANANATDALRAADALGRLTIGRRAWLASACIFHANRVGLTDDVLRGVVGTLSDIWQPPEQRGL